MTSIAEETAQAQAAGEQPKGTKKARVRAQRAHVAPKKAKSAKKASPAKKAPKGAKKAAGTRDGSKTATILEMLKRPGGATAKELLKATGWQPHSLRGFLSGTVGKKLGLTVVSTKGEDGERGACLPVKFCQRVTATSTYAGSSSMANDDRPPHAFDRLLGAVDGFRILITVLDMPEGALLPVSVPMSRASDGVPARFMLPVVVAAAHHQRWLRPHDLTANLEPQDSRLSETVEA
jgi:hypothetical protein